MLQERSPKMGHSLRKKKLMPPRQLPRIAKMISDLRNKWISDTKHLLKSDAVSKLHFMITFEIYSDIDMDSQLDQLGFVQPESGGDSVSATSVPQSSH